MTTLRLLGQIGYAFVIVAALLLLRAFAPFVTAIAGPDLTIDWALRLSGQLDRIER